jgi:glycosyltransferase involved in cell wall biosynthesis
MRLLALVEARDHVCFRYRIDAFSSALTQAGVTLVQQPLEPDPLGRWKQLGRIREFDAVILQRKLLPGWQFHRLRRNAKRLIFDFDDAVLYRDSYSTKGPISRSRTRRFARTVNAADVVLAGNPFLADCAIQVGARSDRVQLMPTCIDMDHYRILDRPTPSEVPQLVWIGSSSTLNGLERERSLWESLGEELPGLTMKIICDRFPEFRGVIVRSVPWSRQTEAHELARGGIGIGLLPDDLWSLGKCGLKILQYQAAGLPVIANPIGAHRDLVHPGVNGYLPSSLEEWIAAVRTLSTDDEARLMMGEAGRRQVESGYSTRVWAEVFVNAATGRRRNPGVSPTSHVCSPNRAGMLASSLK